jgi:raffinose/stachyose/melibiose transport system permease protein
MAGTTVLQIGLGFIFGYMLYLQLRGYKVFKSIFFTPVVLMTVAVGFIFNYIFSPAVGLLEPLMNALGLGEHYFPPLADSTWALVIVIFTHTWQFLGIQIMMFNTGFMNLPQEVIEMATIDGASGLKMIRHMIIPLTREITKTIIILQMIGALRAFDVVYVMTGGGPNHSTEVLPMHMFVQAFENFNIGNGSVVAVVIFVVCLGLTIISRKAMGQEDLQY